MKSVKVSTSFLIAALVLFFSFSLAQEYGVTGVNDFENILPVEKRAKVMEEWLIRRLDTIIPDIMDREGIDMWLIICGENNEDPVYLTMMPEPALMAAGTSFIVFYDTGTGVERYASGGYVPIDHIYKSLPRERGKDRFESLADFIGKRNPEKIGINMSDNWNFGDGLPASKYLKLKEALGDNYSSRLVSAERLCVAWLETRSQQELSVYRYICGIAHDMIAEMFSNKVVVPGITKSDDLVWWWRQKVVDLGLKTWFQPTLRIQRYVEGEGLKKLGYGGEKIGEEDKIIRRGDLIHCDVGIVYLGLATDTQELAYICKKGEEDAPQGLKQGLKNANRLQDIFMNEFKEGRSGYDIAHTATEKAKAEGLIPSIYSHPIGFHGHGAGTTLGSYSRGVTRSVRADYPVVLNTCYSIELNNGYNVPEWGNEEVKFYCEEDAMFTEDGCKFIDGRQTKLYLIK